MVELIMYKKSIKRTNEIIRITFISMVLMISFGCASMKSHKEHFIGIQEKIEARDFASAIIQLETSKDSFYSKKDRVLYYLDLGMLYHYNKEYKKSNEMLTKAENSIEELFSKSISKAALSLIVNDNVMEYSGEDYEDIYLNIFKAMNYLALENFDSAFVEIRRINNKLNLLSDKYKKLADGYNSSKNSKKKMKPAKNKFHNSALGRYLSLLIYRTEGKLDDARIDKEKITEAFKLQRQIYDFAEPNIETSLKKSSNAKLNIVSFIGQSPDKKANVLYVHTEKDLIVIATTKENPRGNQQLKELDTISWPEVKEGYHFKFSLPKMVRRGTDVKNIKIIVDGKIAGELQLIEDIENVAVESYKIKEPIIYLKTIIRTVTKGLLAEKGKERMTENISNPLLGFAARLATDIAVDSTENADLRIGRFFPSDGMIGEIEVTPGIHNIQIEYFGKNNTKLFVDNVGEKDLKRNELNLIESFYLN